MKRVRYVQALGQKNSSLVKVFSNMLEILQFPFMQRALIAGILLAVLLAYLGIFVTMRRMAFFSDGIAHASLAGVAIGILAGVSPLPIALVTSVAIAIGIYYLEKKTDLSTDAVIGILFTAGMALGVVLMSLQSGYQPELVSFLFGNILAIQFTDLVVIIALSIVILGFLLTQHKKLTLLSLDEHLAHVAGMRPEMYKLLLYIFLSVAVVLGIKILGVVLVSALLIIPVSAGRMISRSFSSLLFNTLVISEITTIGGIFLSYYLNLPTGAVIVLFGTLLFLGVFGYTKFAR